MIDKSAVDLPDGAASKIASLIASRQSIAQASVPWSKFIQPRSIFTSVHHSIKARGITIQDLESGMAIREDLVASAVTFLQDPSVSSAPEDKRIAFLQSKNLTKEEVDAALARAGSPGPEQVTVQTNYKPQSQQVIRQPPLPPQSQYGYNGYPGYWQQQPPPDVPKRDWRDYFIMATVMSGVGYGLYYVAKRYIVPIIAPPTPPQLDQDKAAVDEAFNRAFSLIEQLSKDTETIKASEEQRTERLDSAIAEFERTVTELKEASRKRDDDTRRLGDDMRGIQDMIPRAMKAQEKNADDRLKDLNQELKSLKTLLNNRMSAGSNSSKPSSNANGVNGARSANEKPANATENKAASTPSDSKPQSPNPLSRFSGRGGIPSWQMAASKNSQSDSNEKSGTVDGTATPEAETAPS